MKITAPPSAERMALDEIRLHDVDLYTRGDAHLAWQTLRAERPVFWQQPEDGAQGFWAVTRWADVRRVLADHKTFTSEQGTAISMLDSTDPAAGKMMQATDPPRHRQLRTKIGEPFSVRATDAFSGGIRSIVKEIVSTASEQDTWDVAESFSRLPMQAAALLMGLPGSDIDPLLRLSYASLAPLDPTYSFGSKKATLFTAHTELLKYFTALIAHRRVKPSADVVSHMIDVEIEGSRLTDGELYLNCLSLILGAVVTTSHVINAAIIKLIDINSGEGRWPQFSQVGSMVEEALRWSSPVTHFMRRARRETQIRGVKIREGEAVTAWIASANRDDQIFERPYVFDLTRSPNRHIAFGSGPHLCVGNNLARLMLWHSFAELSEVLESFELAGAPRHLVSNEIAGIVSMPLSVKCRIK